MEFLFNAPVPEDRNVTDFPMSKPLVKKADIMAFKRWLVESQYALAHTRSKRRPNRRMAGISSVSPLPASATKIDPSIDPVISSEMVIPLRGTSRLYGPAKSI